MPTRRKLLQLKQKKLQLIRSSLQYLKLLKQKRGNIHKKVKRRYWVHPVNHRRSLEGAWETYLNQCRDQFPDKYKDVLRMNSDLFKELLSIVEISIAKKDTFFRKSIPAEQRLSLTIFYLSTGDSFKTISILFRIGQSTVRSIVFETCQAIWENMKDIYLKTPNTREEWETIAKGFNNLWNFPNCLGAIDGKHCAIQCPPATGSEYFNYKRYFSIVLLGVCDSNYRFTYVDVGTSGRWSDGGTFEQCSLNAAISDKTLNIPEPTNLPGNVHHLHLFIQFFCQLLK